MIVAKSALTWQKLTIGTAGKILRSDGTDLLYTTLTIPDTVTSGALLHASSANVLAALALGTANQVLGMNSGATAYEHKTVTAGAGITVTHAANSITVADDGTGWISVSDAWTYSSADAPTFVITVPSDATTRYSVGMRIRLTQTTVKYFIITAVTATTLTVYGGTDYVLVNAAISAISFSSVKAPFGFPMNPDKWTVLVRDTTLREQLTPVALTWYNLGSVSINIPIGVWRVEYFILMDHIKSTLNETSMSATLSDGAATQGDQDMTSKGYAFFNGATSASNEGSFHGTAGKIFALTVKATWYMNAMTTLATSASLRFLNSTYPNNIRAISAYL